MSSYPGGPLRELSYGAEILIQHLPVSSRRQSARTGSLSGSTGPMKRPTWSITSRHGKRREHRFVQRQLAAVELQVDVPAERRDRAAVALEPRPRQHAARQHHVADAADAERRAATASSAGATSGATTTTARASGAELGERGQGAAVVEAVAGRLDDDRAREAELALHGAVAPTPARAAA